MKDYNMKLNSKPKIVTKLDVIQGQLQFDKIAFYNTIITLCFICVCSARIFYKINSVSAQKKIDDPGLYRGTCKLIVIVFVG